MKCTLCGGSIVKDEDNGYSCLSCGRPAQQPIPDKHSTEKIVKHLVVVK